jgi:glycosyltransferase involved in cell wall biosynthesis
MKFLIITHVPHIVENKQFFAYAPYVREMDIWSNYVEELIILAPKVKAEKSAIELNYNHQKIRFIEIESFDLLNIKSILKSILNVPKICCQIYGSMKSADHIHLRCPGNVGLLGCIIQVFFPSKPKSAKYAGNWDSKSKQPLSYRLQRWILSNTLFTKNMQVLVYGEWDNSSKNIKSFFTATYSENEKLPFQNKKSNQTFKFIFVGTLVKGKNPFYAIQLIENLIKRGLNVQLEFYGDGIIKTDLQGYVCRNKLENYINFFGNQSKEVVKTAYQGSHFVILPSESEGWPKAIAEGMFWGCVPISTRVSCIPYMLDFGNRGCLLHI